jgi:pantoate--beta-alanine ligase
MIVTRQITEIRAQRWREPRLTWGLVPTMGALHQGHISLIRQAQDENDRTAVSIFVNPIQFNNPHDLKTYPVSLEKDLEILTKEKIDLLWIPAANDIYTGQFQTFVTVEQISKSLEGKSRPGHFKGVATIVAILFNVFQPDRAYFGEKDAQQLRVIRQMVDDMKYNLKIISCPTVREQDGLAVSSRNRNLSKSARKQAGCLFQALSAAHRAILDGERRAVRLKRFMKDSLHAYPLVKIDYISVADEQSLQEIGVIKNRTLLSLAVMIGKVRLIDNLMVDLKDI